MKTTYKYLFCGSVLIMLSGCLLDSGSDTIVGKYNVCWIDLHSSRSIDWATGRESSGGAQIVPAYVYAVGHNSQYIIAKQHPANGELIDKKKTFYYIIDMSKQGTYSNKGDPYGVLGPLNIKGFDSLTNVLNINKVKFDMTYPENL